MRLDGTRRWYRARPEGLGELRRWVESMWTDNLRDLKRAEREQRARARSEEAVTDVEVSIRIEARPATVFRYFIDPDRMTAWMGVSAELDPSRVASFASTSAAATSRSASTSRSSRPSASCGRGAGRAATTIPPGSSTVEVTLTPDGDATVVHLRHSGLPGDDAEQEHREGWTHYVSRLAIAGSGGDPGPDPPRVARQKPVTKRFGGVNAPAL